MNTHGSGIRQRRERSVASWNVRYLLAYAEKRGWAPAVLVERFGVDAAALDDIDGRVPLAVYFRMWNELPVLLDDPDMPLHVIEHAAQAEPPLNALVFLSSPTLGQALERMARYQRITFDLANDPVGELQSEGERTHVVLSHERSAMTIPTGAVIDACLGIVTLARMATGREVRPVEIQFRHPRPACPARYCDAFDCPIQFGASRDRMSFASTDLALPIPEASRTLLTILEHHAQHALCQLPAEEDLLSELRRMIRTRLADGDVTLQQLAGALRTSRRTLQRRLRTEGTTLRRLVDEERRQLAFHYIRDPGTSLVDIAFRLGFADQSAFTRAFSRWAACSPTEYRRRLS